MADLYDTLSADDQTAFRKTLASKISQAACPTVDLAGVSGPDDLRDHDSRAIAIDCFQTMHGLASPAGVLDAATYKEIMAWPTWAKVAAVAAAGIGALMLFGGRRRRKKR